MSSDGADPENTRDSFDICTVKRVSLIWNYKCESWIFKPRIFFWFSVYNIITISSLLLISERDMWWLITGTRSRRNEKWTRFHANDSISKYFCNLISWIGRSVGVQPLHMNKGGSSSLGRERVSRRLEFFPLKIEQSSITHWHSSWWF